MTLKESKIIMNEKLEEIYEIIDTTEGGVDPVAAKGLVRTAFYHGQTAGIEEAAELVYNRFVGRYGK